MISRALSCHRLCNSSRRGFKYNIIIIVISALSFFFNAYRSPLITIDQLPRYISVDKTLFDRNENTNLFGTSCSVLRVSFIIRLDGG